MSAFDAPGVEGARSNKAPHGRGRGLLSMPSGSRAIGG